MLLAKVAGKTSEMLVRILKAKRLNQISRDAYIAQTIIRVDGKNSRQAYKQSINLSFARVQCAT